MTGRQVGRDLSCGHRLSPSTRGPRAGPDGVRTGGVRAGWTPRPHPTAQACVTSKHGVTQLCSSSIFTPGLTFSLALLAGGPG